jgi:hypothetical protein
MSLKLKSGQDVYILLIESEKLLKAGDPECYCYASFPFALEVAKYFRSPIDALNDAMQHAAAISPIASVGPSLGFDEFVGDSDLQKYVTP